MSPPGRPKGEYRSAQHEGSPVNATGYPHPPLRGTLSRSRERAGVRVARSTKVIQ